MFFFGGYILKIGVLGRCRIVVFIYVRCVFGFIIVGWRRTLTGFTFLPFSQCFGGPNHGVGFIIVIENDLTLDSDLLLIREVDPVTCTCLIKTNEIAEASTFIEFSGIDDLYPGVSTEGYGLRQVWVLTETCSIGCVAVECASRCRFFIHAA